MKLYYSPGACSLSPHIVLREAGLEFSVERVDLKAHRTQSGADFAEIHGKNYVPVLELDDGQRLTEGAVIVQYLADLSPETGLVPARDSLQRYRLQEWLNFIASELHKTFNPLFRRDELSDDWRQWLIDKLGRHFDWISTQLWESSWLLGGRFGVADAYLFTILNWTSYVGIDLSRWPVLEAYVKRVAARPAVRAAMLAEGLPVEAAA
ncbi:MAG TPA: glutathione transferase GstA [Povalibacter sp.]|nr:glutathione transferase GstA [Povalibacter sp.]